MSQVINIMTYVLDDNQIVLELVKKAFDNAGINEYRMFTDDKEFLKGEEPVHIAVIDYSLKGEVTGLDVLKALLKTNPNCFVIMVSAQDDINVVVEALNSGCRGYVRKIGDYIPEVVKWVQEAILSIVAMMEYYTELKTKQDNLKAIIDGLNK